MQLVLVVADEDDGLRAHAALEEVAAIGHEGLVSDEEPSAAVDLLELLGVDVGVDVDLPADEAVFEIDEATQRPVAQRGQ